MNLIWTPSSISIANGKTKYVYDCPKCKAPLTCKIHRDKIVKVLLPWAPLSKFICLRCFHTCYVLAATKQVGLSKETTKSADSRYPVLIPEKVAADAARHYRLKK